LKGFLKTYNVARRPMEQVAKVASKNRMPPLMKPGIRGEKKPKDKVKTG
jgi:hypothetical protein